MIFYIILEQENAMFEESGYSYGSQHDKISTN